MGLVAIARSFGWGKVFSGFYLMTLSTFFLVFISVGGDVATPVSFGTNNLQVLNSVVTSIAIDVMNHFVFFQGAL
jgi:hypothetical protein